jgi:flagellar motor switch protein FliN/FliY
MSSDISHILRLEVPLIVVLGRREMNARDVIALAPGAIIEIPKSAEEELELLVNNKCVGQGRAVKVGENFGIRMSFVGELKDRIEALGEAPASTEERSKQDQDLDALAEALLLNQG